MRNWNDHVITIGLVTIVVAGALLYYGIAEEKRKERLCKEDPSPSLRRNQRRVLCRCPIRGVIAHYDQI